MRRGLDSGGTWLVIFDWLGHGGLSKKLAVANALPLTGKSSPEAGMPASSRSAVNIILFWDNPMMGSAYPADDISHPRNRQIRPFARPGCLLRVNGWRAQGSRVDSACPRPSLQETAVLCRQIRGWRTPARRR